MATKNLTRAEPQPKNYDKIINGKIIFPVPGGSAEGTTASGFQKFGSP
jgi:hypothetical protein